MHGHQSEYEREKRLFLEKGKRGAAKVIFGRSVMIVILLLVQIGIFIGFGTALKGYMMYYYGASFILELLLILYIINGRNSPEIQIAWIIPIALIPVFGSLFYICFSDQLASRLMNKRLQKLIADTKDYAKGNPATRKALEEESVPEANLAKYLEEVAGFPVYQNTSVKYFPSGETKFRELLVQLEKAEKFIFMEYFIVAEGYMWETILELLQKKVKEGVEVRFMYDGMCSFAILPWNYPKKLEAMGIHCKMFSPVKPIFSTYQNNRDHRKIVVIDGQTAFTGGINLADEYINKKVRFGHWKDTAVMLQGEAVRSFTLMFLQMWEMTEREEDFRRYLDVPVCLPQKPAKGYAIPYGDSPLDHEKVGEWVYLDIINRAQRYVHIMTPYLILDHDLITALTFAAKRGVEVVIIMPHIPDKVYAFALAKTYYPQLIDAGVQIWEYTPGFVHAKVFVSDDERAVVGTINLDYRSLYLHFECGVYLYQTEELEKIEEDVQQTLEKSQRITKESCRREKPGLRIFGKVLRLIAPLM